MRKARNKLDEYKEDEDEYEDDVIEFDSFDDLLQHVNEEHEWYTHEENVEEQRWLEELYNGYGCDPDDIVVAYWMHKDEDDISLDTMIDTINSFYEQDEE